MTLNKTLINLKYSKNSFFNLEKIKDVYINIDLFKENVAFKLYTLYGYGRSFENYKENRFINKNKFIYYKYYHQKPVRGIIYYYQSKTNYFHIITNLEEYNELYTNKSLLILR